MQKVITYPPSRPSPIESSACNKSHVIKAMETRTCRNLQAGVWNDEKQLPRNSSRVKEDKGKRTHFLGPLAFVQEHNVKWEVFASSCYFAPQAR